MCTEVLYGWLSFEGQHLGQMSQHSLLLQEVLMVLLSQAEVTETKLNQEQAVGLEWPSVNIYPASHVSHCLRNWFICLKFLMEIHFLSNLFVHMLYLLVYSWKSCWWKTCLVFLIWGQNNEQTHKHCIYLEIITQWDFLFWLLFKSLCIKIHLCRYFEISLHGATCSTLWLVSPVTKLHQGGKKVSLYVLKVIVHSCFTKTFTF